MKTLFSIIGAVVLLFGFLIFLKKCEFSKKPGKEIKTGAGIDSSKQKVSDGTTAKLSLQPLEISFSGVGDTTIFMSPGINFGFMDATVSYCCKNKAGVEACGNAGEDVAEKLLGSNQKPDSEDNTELTFSSNGKPLSLKILRQQK